MNLQLENKLRGVESDRPGDCRKCGLALERNPAFQEEAKTSYTCPMHPEIRQDQPGYCPICGMALEPVTVTGEPQGENSEAKEMTLRFWVATILTAPVSLLAMAHFIPGLHVRSEEHTSELQSRENLVCRLLL